MSRTRQSKRIRYHLPLLLLLGAMMVLGLWSIQALAQIPTLPASHDALVDPNNPTTNYNAQRLEVTYSNFPGFTATRLSLLQFDLSGFTTIVDRSRLVIDLVENNLPAGATVDLALYGADDDWNETSVTFATSPTPGTLLQTIEITTGSTGPISFAASAVGSYIEQERSGDGAASFLLRLDAGSGDLGFAGNLLFEDREGTDDGVNGNEPFIDVYPRTDLAVSKRDAADPVLVGNHITYTLTITNHGPDIAQSVVITDLLPGGVGFVSASPAQGTCGQGVGVITCNLSSLTNGTSTSVTIVVTSTAVGTITNRANVASDTTDPIPGNNGTAEQTTIDPAKSSENQTIYLPLILKSS